MADIRIVDGGEGRYVIGNGPKYVYVNGHRLTEVLSVEPDLLTPNELATVTIKMGVTSLEYGHLPDSVQEAWLTRMVASLKW